MKFEFNDGGRSEAGYKGKANDCVVRSIAIATGKLYQEVYDDLFVLANRNKETSSKGKSPREGVYKKIFHDYILNIGWEWVPTMKIGQGCKVHLQFEELPEGMLIVKVSKHLTAVCNGTIFDTFDPSREGKRCVYGYYKMK